MGQHMAGHRDQSEAAHNRGVYVSFHMVRLEDAMNLADGTENPVYTMFGEPNKDKYKYACYLDMLQVDVDIIDRDFRAPGIPQGVSMRKGEFPAGKSLTASIKAAIADRMGLQDNGTFKTDRNSSPEPHRTAGAKRRRKKSPTTARGDDTGPARTGEEPSKRQRGQDDTTTSGAGYGEAPPDGASPPPGGDAEAGAQGPDGGSETPAQPEPAAAPPPTRGEAYQGLGIKVGATLGEAKKAYKRLALVRHPDKNGGTQKATEEFKRLRQWWDLVEQLLTRNTSESDTDDTGQESGDGEEWYEATDLESAIRIVYPRVGSGPVQISEWAWTYAWESTSDDEDAPGELIDLLMAVLQTKIEQSDPDNSDILYAGPSQSWGMLRDSDAQTRASIKKGQLKAFTAIPVKMEGGPWSVVIICNKSKRYERKRWRSNNAQDSRHKQR